MEEQQEQATEALVKAEDADQGVFDAAMMAEQQQPVQVATAPLGDYSYYDYADTMPPSNFPIAGQEHAAPFDMTFTGFSSPPQGYVGPNDFLKTEVELPQDNTHTDIFNANPAAAYANHLALQLHAQQHQQLHAQQHQLYHYSAMNNFQPGTPEGGGQNGRAGQNGRPQSTTQPPTPANNTLNGAQAPHNTPLSSPPPRRGQRGGGLNNRMNSSVSLPGSASGSPLPSRNASLARSSLGSASSTQFPSAAGSFSSYNTYFSSHGSSGLLGSSAGLPSYAGGPGQGGNGRTRQGQSNGTNGTNGTNGNNGSNGNNECNGCNNCNGNHNGHDHPSGNGQPQQLFRSITYDVPAHLLTSYQPASRPAPLPSASRALNFIQSVRRVMSYDVAQPSEFPSYSMILQLSHASVGVGQGALSTEYIARVASTRWYPLGDLVVRVRVVVEGDEHMTEPGYDLARTHVLQSAMMFYAHRMNWLTEQYGEHGVRNRLMWNQRAVPMFIAMQPWFNMYNGLGEQMQREIAAAISSNRYVGVTEGNHTVILNSGQPSNGQPSNGQPSNGQPSNGQPSNDQTGNGQPSNGQTGNGSNSNGLNGNGLNGNGLNANGMNANGLNGNGLNANGSNGNGLNGNRLNGNGLNGNGLNGNGVNGNGLNSNGPRHDSSRNGNGQVNQNNGHDNGGAGNGGGAEGEDAAGKELEPAGAPIPDAGEQQAMQFDGFQSHQPGSFNYDDIDWRA